MAMMVAASREIAFEQKERDCDYLLYGAPSARVLLVRAHLLVAYCNYIVYMNYAWAWDIAFHHRCRFPAFLCGLGLR
jgi:hypothetical protein